MDRVQGPAELQETGFVPLGLHAGQGKNAGRAEALLAKNLLEKLLDLLAGVPRCSRMPGPGRAAGGSASRAGVQGFPAHPDQPGFVPPGLLQRLEQPGPTLQEPRPHPAARVKDLDATPSSRSELILARALMFSTPQPRPTASVSRLGNPWMSVAVVITACPPRIAATFRARSLAPPRWPEKQADRVAALLVGHDHWPGPGSCPGAGAPAPGPRCPRRRTGHGRRIARSLRPGPRPAGQRPRPRGSPGPACPAGTTPPRPSPGPAGPRSGPRPGSGHRRPCLCLGRSTGLPLPGRSGGRG